MERFEANLVKIAAGDVSNIPQDLLADEAINASQSARTHICDILDSCFRVGAPVEWVRSWVENKNPDAAEAFDFEWMNAKRIAQHSQGQKGHRPVVNKRTDVCARVYRLKRWGMSDGSWVKLGCSSSRTVSSGSRSSMIRDGQKLSCCS